MKLPWYDKSATVGLILFALLVFGLPAGCGLVSCMSDQRLEPDYEEQTAAEQAALEAKLAATREAALGLPLGAASDEIGTPAASTEELELPITSEILAQAMYLAARDYLGPEEWLSCDECVPTVWEEAFWDVTRSCGYDYDNCDELDSAIHEACQRAGCK
jgi:hypothetical protein